jgi:hypothetical protein
VLWCCSECHVAVRPDGFVGSGIINSTDTARRARGVFRRLPRGGHIQYTTYTSGRAGEWWYSAIFTKLIE